MFSTPESATTVGTQPTSLVEGVPIVGPVVGELLYLLARISKATRILKLG